MKLSSISRSLVYVDVDVDIIVDEAVKRVVDPVRGHCRHLSQETQAPTDMR